MSPEQEREIEAREECARRGIDPDEICADGGVTAWMVVDQELRSTRGDRGWQSNHPMDEGILRIQRVMSEKTQADAVLAELLDRRLLNDVDDDLHHEIAAAIVKAVHEKSLLLTRARQFIADAGCDEDDNEVNRARDQLLAEIDAATASDTGCGQAVIEPWRDQ